MNIVQGTKATINEAVHTFKLDSDGMPELVPLGIPPLDTELGGLGPGAMGILAAATGVGKSSTVLTSMLASPVKVGCVSVEDGPDVVGTRLLSALTGINSLRIRRKDLTDKELRLIAKAVKSNKMDHMYYAYPIGGKVEKVCEAIKEMAKLGVKLVWIDYLQEVHQHGRADRRMEINEVMSRIHEEAADSGVAVMMLSQFRRLGDGEKIPQIYHLKESGDIENKARIIILAHKIVESEDTRVRFRLAKSTYGGEHITYDMTRDASGTLKHAKLFNICEDF
jgi:replicative DNA helicase